MEFCVKLLSLPSWERGLKSSLPGSKPGALTVAPLVGAWIEILILSPAYSYLVVAPLVGAWIEIVRQYSILAFISRRSPRGSVD